MYHNRHPNIVHLFTYRHKVRTHLNSSNQVVRNYSFRIVSCVLSRKIICCDSWNDRTKLKQTEVDCEYLKRCCEAIREENRRLQKELQELRALGDASNSNSFYVQLPATTRTMCPSCKCVTASNTATKSNLKKFVPMKPELSWNTSSSFQTPPANLFCINSAEEWYKRLEVVYHHLLCSETHDMYSYQVSERIKALTRGLRET